MRMRLGLAILALVPLPQAAASDHIAAVAISRPAYLNIIVESPTQPEQPPRWRLERIEGVSPEVTCESFMQVTEERRRTFTVQCVDVEEPIVLSNEVTIQGRRCENAAVRAQISGPVFGEYVTGTITCGEPPLATSASCTATASTSTVLNPLWSGECFQLAPNGPLPIRCTVDLTGVLIDRWQVTCYGTDP